MRRFCYAVVVALLLSAVVSPATAQTVLPDYSVQFRGIEVSLGVIFNDVRYGTSFVGSASGDLQGTWAVSFCYTPPHPGLGVTNEILGGTWALSVRRAGRVVGTLFGTIEQGEAKWNGLSTEPEEAAVWAYLNVTGGTGVLRGKCGSAVFCGTLSHEYLIPRMWGDLDIYLKP